MDRGTFKLRAGTSIMAETKALFHLEKLEASSKSAYSWIKDSLPFQTAAFILFTQAVGFVYCWHTFGLDWRYSLPTSVVVALAQGLLFWFNNLWRSVAYLTFPDYFTGIGRIVLAAILMNLILAGPVLRIADQVSALQNSSSCLESKFQEGVTKTYREGLQNVEKRLVNSLNKINDYTGGYQHAVETLASNIVNVENALTTVVGQAESLYSGCSNGLNTAQSSCHNALGRSTCTNLVFKTVCVSDLINVESVCNKVIPSGLICKAVPVPKGIKEGFVQIQKAAKTVEELLNLNISVSTKGSAEIEGPDKVKDLVVETINRYWDNVQIIRAVVWTIAGILLVLKPILNAGMLLRKNKKKAKFVLPWKVLMLKMMSAIVTVLVMIFCYLTEYFLAVFTCLSSASLSDVDLDVKGNFSANLGSSGGVLGKFLAGAIVGSFNDDIRLNVKVDAGPCLPECEQGNYYIGEYFTFGVCAVMLFATFYGDKCAVEVKNKILTKCREMRVTAGGY